MIRKLFDRVFIFVFVAIIISSFIPATFVNAGAQRIRVAVYPLGSFMSIDDSGNASGYGIDYLNEISKYTNWKYEYVSCNSWLEAGKLLKSGDVDIAGPLQKSETREKQFYFPEYDVGTAREVLYVRKDDDRYYLDDYESFDGMKVALLANSEISNNFMEFVKEKKIDVKVLYYSTEEECFFKLDNGMVDAFAGGALSGVTNYKNVCRFGLKKCYFVTDIENAEIGEQLNAALGNIAAQDKGFQGSIYQKYYNVADATLNLSFTREEADLISSTDKLKVAFIPNRAPFSYADSDGNIAGITYDIMKDITDKMGIELDAYLMPPGVTAMEYFKQNSDCLVAGIMTENAAFKNENYIVSDQFYSDDVGIVAKKGFDYEIDGEFGKYILAVSKSYSALKTYIEQNCPQFKAVYVDSVSTCLDMVESGKADFAAQNVHVLSPLLSDPHYEDLTIMPTFLYEETMGIVALNNEENVKWIGIANKCIGAISEEFVSQIVVDHMVVNGYKTTFGDFVYKFRYAIIPMLILSVGIISLFIVFNTSKRKHTRILEKTNKQLEVAIEKANRASASKGDFLAQMSHEIRTPMNAIIGLTDLAHLDIKNPEKMEEYLIKVDGSSKLLLGIINDVLDMSKIENHKLKIDNEVFNFKQLLGSITTIYYQQCKQKGIKYEMKMKNVTEENVIGDSLRINQIILNLLSNAVKFTPAGGVVTVSVIQTSISNDTVHMRFMVSDTGCGMSDDLKERLFQPFEQEDASTARKHGGSGLGLAICKNLTELMNGEIEVRSKLNEGSTFVVDIPFGRSYEQPPINNDVYKDVRVMVVDDDEEACKYIGSILERMDIRYTVKTDGEEALDEIGDAEDKEDSYNVCIVDWKMPKMSGLDLTKEIREVFGDSAVVVIISAYDLNEIEVEGKKAGADYFIPKPLFQSTLNDVFMKVASGEHSTEIAEKNVGSDYHFENKRVLIAEDIVLNMEVAVRLLELVGVTAECAEDGKQAVEMFEKSVPGYYDAILMDINMPVMDGYEAAKTIRASKHVDAKSVTIYAMTANAFSEDVAKCINMGMDGHIVKPIETKILYQMLDRAFNGDGE